jgi:3-oxoadipate enol-lactonase
MPRLAGRHRVIRYDVRGFGRSPRPSVPYSLLDDLTAVLDHFGLERVSLVGCSLGGGTALTFALAHPDRVNAMVLLCPGVIGYPWPEEPDLDTEFAALAQAGDAEGLMAFGLRVWGASGANQAVTAQIASMIPLWTTPDQFRRPDPPVYDRLDQITIPTLLMVGELDRPSMIDCTRRSAAKIPGARLIHLDGVDHFPSLRAPELVADAILTHCTDNIS